MKHIIFISIALIITLGCRTKKETTYRCGKGISEHQYFINNKNVSEERYKSFVDSLGAMEEVPHTWYCGESTTGGRTGYQAKDKSGTVWIFDAISESDRNETRINKKNEENDK
jgi:hypothetical protein